MSKSNIISYADVQSLMDKAIAAEHGIKFPILYGQAVRLRQRCYALRKLLRQKSWEIYAPTDPMYNKTPYDELIFPDPPRVSKDKITEMRIEKGKIVMNVEEITS